MADRVILYRAPGAHPSWVTDVVRRDDGDIAVCSGDGRREWYMIVAAADVAALRAALGPALAEADVLDLMAQRFGGDKNPYNAIGVLLAEARIPHRTDVW